jgi:Ca2+-binding RTX toxin-like protein
MCIVVFPILKIHILSYSSCNNGGIGNYTYNFNLGDGNDIIIDTQGVDAIVFGDGIVISDVSITKNGNDLLLTINAQDSMLLKDTTENRVIESIMAAFRKVSISTKRFMSLPLPRPESLM